MKEEVSDQKAFEKYFSDKDLFLLFQYKDDIEGCETLDLIMKKDGITYEKTPTNVKHIQFWQQQTKTVKGITVNSNLYSNLEDETPVEENKYQYRGPNVLAIRNKNVG